MVDGGSVCSKHLREVQWASPAPALVVEGLVGRYFPWRCPPHLQIFIMTPGHQLNIPKAANHDQRCCNPASASLNWKGRARQRTLLLVRCGTALLCWRV